MDKTGQDNKLHPIIRYRYMVGALLNAKLTPEREQERLNLCGNDDWELVSVITKTHDSAPYTFYYLRRQMTEDCPNPRFDTSLFELST